MKIGLTYTGSDEKHLNYVRWLQNGEDIDVVKLSAEADNVEAVLNCDALVLSGGVDIHPKFYGSNTLNYEGRPEKFNEGRDAFETDAYFKALKNNLPVLGICRGMQLINVVNNGTLVQNLQDEKINIYHVGNPDKRHEVTILQNTFLHNIIGDEKVTVNSAHHQAIDVLGNGLKVNAISDDGIIEGIESDEIKERPFLLGIQWHPERMYQFNAEKTPASQNIRIRFLDAIKKSISK